MHCKYCGNKLEEEAKFCSKCGKLVSEENDEFFGETKTEYVNPKKEEEKDALAKKILTCSIVSLAIGVLTVILLSSVLPILLGVEFGLSFDSAEMSTIEFESFGLTTGYLLFTAALPIVGLSIAKNAKKDIDTYVQLYGETNGKASVGKGLSIPATIVNAIMIGCYCLLLTVCVICML